MGSSAARMRRAAALMAVLVVGLAGWTAAPASAHSSPSHFTTAITSVEPVVRGVSVSARPDGRYLSITNPTHRTVIVLGYDAEEYVKITEHGVWQNTHSPATYLNQEPAVDLPAGANPHVTAQWQQVSNKETWRYHDHRIHWTGNTRPAVVTQSPNKPHLIRTWTVELLVDGTPVSVNGTLKWYPSGTGVAGIAFGILCATLLVGFTVALVLDERRSASKRPPMAGAGGAARAAAVPAQKIKRRSAVD